MARIKAIFGRVNTQAKSVQFCVWGNDSQSKGNYRREKEREEKRLRSSDVLMDPIHQRLNLIPGLGVTPRCCHMTARFTLG